MSNVRDRSTTIKIIAHRGVLDRAPGNTLAAFRDAHRLGVDGVELDVRLSRDRLPVVHHNWYLDETVPQPVPIFTLSAKELRAETVWDDRPEFSRQHPIPTLEEVLQELAGKFSLEIELKSPEPELPAAVASALAPFRATWPGIELTSVSTSLLAAVREHCPGIRTALLLGSTPPYMHSDALAYFAAQSARLANADAVHLAPNDLGEELMAALRSSGTDVHVYPVNDEPTFDLISRYRIPEVVTDDPVRMLELRGSRG